MTPGSPMLLGTHTKLFTQFSVKFWAGSKSWGLLSGISKILTLGFFLFQYLETQEEVEEKTIVFLPLWISQPLLMWVLWFSIAVLKMEDV